MPPTVLLSCEAITKAFGARPLFRGLTLAVREGDRVGLVGPNGTGKSTLLKILSGDESPDAGIRTVRKHTRIGHVPQDPVFAPGKTAEQVVIEALAADGPAREHERVQHAAQALSKAGFVDHGLKTDVLSGGWRKRLAIATQLARAPDVLLLDEPTNHLDVEGILWLEQLLMSESRAFVVVSHDRYFLQNVARRMLELNPTYEDGLFGVEGSYADFLEGREEYLAHRAANRERLTNLVRREVAWLRQGAKARTSKSKSRLDSAARSIDELAESRRRERSATAGIDFNASDRKTRRLWVGEGVGLSFDGRSIVRDLDLVLTPGTRLGVLGANGSGKTTLLRILVGEQAIDSGSITRAERLRVAYFDQNRETLDPALTLRRALAPHGDSVVYRDAQLHVASWARRFLFSSEQLDMPVSQLSGGERARIHLARLMLLPADLLVLDEPTNDLDIETLQVLEESLVEFPGALVLVTHDRYMLDRVATRLLALDGEGHAGHYADFAQWDAERRAAAKSKAKGAGRKPRAGQDSSPRPRRLSYLEQREWESMERSVLEAEERAETARTRAEDPQVATDAAALHGRLIALAEAQSEVDRLYARWAELEALQKDRA